MTNRLYIFSVEGQKEAQPEAWERRRRKAKGTIPGQTRHVSVWKRKGKGSKRDGHSCMMKYKTSDANLGSQCAAHHESGRTAYIEKGKKEWITRHGPERSDWQTDWRSKQRRR